MQEHADGITLSANANLAVSSNVHPAVGVAVDKNGKWRRTMEDAHTFIHDFDQVPGQGYFAISMDMQENSLQNGAVTI